MTHRTEEKRRRRESPAIPAKAGIRSVASMAVVLALAGMIQLRSHSQVMASKGPNTLTIGTPDGDEPMGQVGRHALREANKRLILDRQKQMVSDSAKLLRLAGDLKAEVDSGSQHALSADAMRKADEIAKLAHNVKEKMRLTIP